MELSIVYNLVVGGLAMSITIFAVVLFFVCRKKPETAGVVDTESSSVPFPPPKLPASWYPLMEIDAATDGFNHRRIIGKGRLGTVYAAVTPKGEVVAVKRIHPRLVLNNAAFGFSSTIKWLSLADHPHVVPITGFSEGPGERIIVMEFGGMLSLEFYLHENRDGAALLDWRRRVRIAAGAARGLEYLHGAAIIHGCVKPSNILVDVKLCARVSDYGLHFVASSEREGVAGYVDQEYWREKKQRRPCPSPSPSKECDVFGFGVVVLELLSGRRARDTTGNIVEWGLPLLKDDARLNGLLDPRLAIPADLRPLIRLSKLALSCVGNCRRDRPSIAQVAAILASIEITL